MMNRDIVWLAFVYLFNIQDVSATASEDCKTYHQSTIECDPIAVEHTTVCYTKERGDVLSRWTATIICQKGFRLNHQIKPECTYTLLSFRWRWSEDIPTCLQVPITREDEDTNISTDEQSGTSPVVYVVPIIIIIVLIAVVIAFLLWRRARRNGDQAHVGVHRRGHIMVTNQTYDDTVIISDVSRTRRSTTADDQYNDDNDYENVQRKISNGNNSRVNNPSKHSNDVM